MAGQGAGPSRRSHTKSRKGCKTCKRRHIRCDETFPQCRNCTKHQVRCDYMENFGSDPETQSNPEQSSLLFTPEAESQIDLWQQTGSFPFPGLQVFPPPQTHKYSTDELRLLYHISSISNDLMLNGTTSLTAWTQKVPKFLSLASSYPYVMHALLSFSANHLAWSQSSTDTRNLHIQHGTIALRGLHEAIGSFSHENADAVLAASLLLLWQATDWRSWSSLRGGIQSVLSAMQQWKHDSIFAEYITEEDLVHSAYAPNRSSLSDSAERFTTLSKTIQALQRLQTSIAGHESESYWTEQLLQYLQRLQSSGPAQSPEEQFCHLYLLRKWIFWVPILLLQQHGGQGQAMLTLAHLYATAVSLESLYPDLGSAFCARLALGPLETILSVTDAMQSQHAIDRNSMEIAALMHFPREAAMGFRVRSSVETPGGGAAPIKDEPEILLSPDALSYTTIGNLSPAFAPSPLHAGTTSPPTLSSSSSYLEVPPISQAPAHAGFTYGTQTWGAIPSPGFPPVAFTADEQQQMYGYSLNNFRGAASGGFVSPAAIWT